MNHPRYSLVHEIRQLWRLAWPILIGQIATVGMGVVDVAMTGHVSATELAAVSLGASVWMIIIVTVIGVMMSMNTVVAHEFGAQRFDRVPHVVRQGLWKALGVGLVATVCSVFSTLVFDYLQLTPDVHERATMFVLITSLFMPAFALYRALYGYTASINQPIPVMVIALGGLAFNIAMNWVLVFGNLGAPRLGAIGCAISTTIGMWLMLAAMLLWIRVGRAYRQTYPFTHWEWPVWAEIRPMARLGVPIGITYFAEVSAFGVVSLLVARFGAVEVSAHQIALNFASLVFMVPMTFGIAMITRVGQALGEGDPLRARFASWVGVWMSLGFALVSAVFILLFREQIAAAYTIDPAVQALCVQLLLFAAVFQLSDATQVAASSAIRGYKVTREPMMIQLLAFWGFALPMGIWLGLAPGWLPFAPAEPMKAHGFWIGLTVGLTIAAVLLTWVLARLAKRRADEFRAAHPSLVATQA
ncbi:MAG TPA: MATE family efflux transporter [Telluria sp.]|nr:MATE family efflux transporter [Telluria sp.]